VNENEWQKGATQYRINPHTDQYGNWRGWDADKDGQLNKKEFADGLGEKSYLEGYDRDRNQQVDEQELREGLFTTWDKNRNGYLEEEEYNENQSFHFGA
jgi:hypothetical protein